MPTTTQILLERVYPGDLAEDVAKMRAMGVSWRSIADAVSDKCELTVTHETLRAWYSPQTPPLPVASG